MEYIPRPASLELGRFVAPESFRGIEAIRAAETFAVAERRFGAPSVRLEELSTSINLGRFGDDFAFHPSENSIFVPLIGNSTVVESLGDLSLKNQNYAQVVIDPARSNAHFVAHFLNSNFGRQLREQTRSGTFIPKLNTLKELRVFVPDLQTQLRMLEIEAKIADEQNTVLELEIELSELRDGKTGVHQRFYGWPLAWTRFYGQGRVFYTALGHEASVWQDPRYQRILTNAILWSMRRSP
jgi:Trehalose utilisation